MAPVAEDRYAERELDARGDRVDVCPTCGGERQELPMGLDTFYCETCEVATIGPNTEVAEKPPEQLGLDVGQPAHELFDEEAPPIDEGMAWIADEMPDE